MVFVFYIFLTTFDVLDKTKLSNNTIRIIIQKSKSITDEQV